MGNKAKSREYYNWCPHGTFNPRGCGVCKDMRGLSERAEKFDAIAAIVGQRDEFAAEIVQHREGLEALADVLYGTGEPRPTLPADAGEAWALLLNKLADVMTSGLREIEQAKDDAATHRARADVSSIDDQG